MHSHSPDERLIPLSDAAKYAGVTPEYLNLLARESKLKAQKLGRNWFTSKKWLGEYFSDSRTDDTEQTRTTDTEVRLRQIEKEERIELARIQAKVEMRRLEKEEKTQHRASGQPEQNETEHQPLELLNLLAREIKSLREDMNQEQGQKQALLFAFEHLQDQVREDIERQVSGVYFQVNDRVEELLIEMKQHQEREAIPDEEKKRFFEFFIRQLNGIKNRLEELEQRGEKPRAYSPYERLDEIKSLVQQELKKDSLTIKQNNNLTKDRKREQIQKRFSQNIVLFKDENFRAESLTLESFKYPLRSPSHPEFRTVFFPRERIGRSGVSRKPRVSQVSFDKPRKQEPKYLVSNIKYQWPLPRPYPSFVLGLLLLIVSFGIMNPNAFSSGNQSTVYSLLSTGKSQLARFGTEQLLFARIGHETGKEMTVLMGETAETFGQDLQIAGSTISLITISVKQTPADIAETLALFSPKDTIYNPKYYAGVLDQPLVPDSKQPVNPAERVVFDFVRTASEAVTTAKESYEETLSVLIDVFNNGSVAGTSTAEHQSTSTE